MTRPLPRISANALSLLVLALSLPPVLRAQGTTGLNPESVPY